MSRWVLVLAVVLGVLGCSTRSVVVKPEEVPMLNDREWTIKAGPRHARALDLASKAADLKPAEPEAARVPGGRVAAPKAGGEALATAGGAGPTVAVAGSAASLAGTWQGSLRMPNRTQADLTPISPATVRIFEDSGRVRWSLTGTYYGRPVEGAGTVERSGDLVRLSGTLRLEGSVVRVGGGGTTETSVVYSGTVSGDSFQGTGVTAGNAIHVLSLRRSSE